MKKTRKVLSVILAVLGVCCLLAAIGLILFHQAEDRRSRQTLEELRNSGNSGTETPSPSQNEKVSVPQDATEGESQDATDEESQDTAAPEPTPEPIENPYLESFLANADMAAWLQIPGTAIDYPVMWTPRNEEYYLRRGFDGSSNRNGCLILDTDSCVSPLTTNLIIHGHNMKSGAMFGTLSAYESEDFYLEHKNLSLYTREIQRNYEVIAVFYSQVYKKSDTVFKFYKFFQADTEAEFDDYYQNIKALSLYDTGVTAEFGDHFITLSTCAYHVTNGRFVVVAKEIESGDVYLPIEE